MIPRNPVLSGRTVFSARNAGISDILDAGQSRLLPAGRLGIVHALRAAGIGAGDAVLVPAYHCLAMIGPILFVGATPVLYPLRPDLSVDLERLQRSLAPAARGLIVVHYFGFLQDMPALRRFCDEHDLCLIEDCAHAFFGELAGKPVGWHGDYAIASFMKFFPVYDGGCLVSSRHSLDALALKGAGWRGGAKAAVNILERALAHGRGGGAARALRPILAIKDIVWKKWKARSATLRQGAAAAAPRAAEAGDGNDIDLDIDWLDRTASLPSRLVLAAASHARVVERRRSNFQRLLQGLQDLPGCRPLFANLPEGTVPWVFPIVFDDVQSAYDRLDSRGVPIPHFGKHLWREADASICSVSNDLSKRCLQLPCHQELSETELQWLIDTVVDAMRAPNHRVSFGE